MNTQKAVETLLILHPDWSRVRAESTVRDALAGKETDGVFVRHGRICVIIA